MMRASSIVSISLLLVLLTGCGGRVLSPSESAFLGTVHKGNLDYQSIKVQKNKLLGLAKARREGIYEGAVTELGNSVSPDDVDNIILSQPEAMVLFNEIYYSSEAYRDDFLEGWPQQINFPDAPLLAHEITHVWQWQHRNATGYTPLKALLEHLKYNNPYSYEIESGKSFNKYRYEQQGAMVQDYVILYYTDIANPKFKALEDLIKDVWPVHDFLKRFKVRCSDRLSIANCKVPLATDTPNLQGRSSIPGTTPPY